MRLGGLRRKKGGEGREWEAPYHKNVDAGRQTK